MAGFRFSRRAFGDLDDITVYSIQTWDEAQANRYLALLHGRCQRLLDTPVLARRCDGIRPGLWRSEVGRHVLFFRREPDDGILVCRVMHERMLPEHHAIDDDEP